MCISRIEWGFMLVIKDGSYLSPLQQMCTDPNICSLPSFHSISETKHFSLIQYFIRNLIQSENNKWRISYIKHILIRFLFLALFICRLASSPSSFLCMIGPDLSLYIRKEHLLNVPSATEKDSCSNKKERLRRNINQEAATCSLHTYLNIKTQLKNHAVKFLPHLEHTHASLQNEGHQ